MSGCTAVGAAVGATAGAAIDMAIITSPLWGPSVVNSEKLGNVERHTAIGPVPNPWEHVSSAPNPASESTPDVLLRVFQGPESGRDQEPGYYSWWAFLPLVPYANRESIVERAWNGETPAENNVEVQGLPSEGAREIRIPLDRLPEGLRPSADGAISAQTRAAVLDIVRGEIASLTPSPSEYAFAYHDSQGDTFLFRLSAFARDRLAQELGPKKVRLELPAMAGRLALVMPGKRRDQYPPKPEWEDREQEETCEDVVLSVSGDELVTVVPSTNLRVFAFARGYEPPADGQVVVTGRVATLRLEVSSISYCVTTVGANLLSLLGAPLSNSRIVMTVELEARRGGVAEPLLVKSETVETSYKAIGLYYGGDYAQELSVELADGVSKILAEFAAGLRTKL
jgi:hypothetical protein